MQIYQVSGRSVAFSSKVYINNLECWVINWPLISLLKESFVQSLVVQDIIHLLPEQGFQDALITIEELITWHLRKPDREIGHFYCLLIVIGGILSLLLGQVLNEQYEKSGNEKIE